MPKRITLLTPVYNEEQTLEAYEKSVSDLFRLSGDHYSWEVFLIDDGSRDRSWEIIRQICARDSRFRGLRLSRNYGSHIALGAGFDRADGDAVATLACDLQDPPQTVLEFLKKWESGAHIVWGKRKTREDGFWRALMSGIFYKLIKRYAMPRDSQFTTGSFLLADRRAVVSFRRFVEKNRVTFALFAWTGFQQAVVEYDRKKRTGGRSGWNFTGMIKAMYDTFIGFSMTPVKLITLLGASTSLLCIPLGLYVLFSWIGGKPLMGYTSIMLSMAFFFGLQFLLMGIMGEYLYRIYTESVRRPLYFLMDTANCKDDFPA